MKTYPDWGAGISVPSDIDYAEIVTRLGSPVTFRRSGRVLYYDTFSSLIPWTTSLVGVGGAIAIDNTHSLHGLSCLQITPAATYSAIYKTFPYVSQSKQGIEINFAYAPTADSTILFQFTITSNPAIGAGYPRQYGGIKINLATNNIYINGTSGDTLLDNYPSAAFAGSVYWTNIKLVVDPLTGYSTNVKINEREYRINDLLNTDATHTVPYIMAYLKVTPAAAPTIPLYFTDFIYTMDEP